MDEIKKLHAEKEKETAELLKTLSYASFLLKSHQETFDNVNIIAEDMAVNEIKRYMMLSAESDGIDLILKLGGEELYKQEEFKIFIQKMNEYFNKIKNNVNYKEKEEYSVNENIVYNKFKLLLEKI
jgi:uridylate kinase